MQRIIIGLTFGKYYKIFVKIVLGFSINLLYIVYVKNVLNMCIIVHENKNYIGFICGLYNTN